MLNFLKSFGRANPVPAAAPISQPTRKGSHQIARAVQRNFKAAESDRLVSGWSTTPMTADAVIQKHQRILVARSREQASNNDHAKSFIRMCRQNIVGPSGVMLQAQSKDGGKLDKETNSAIEAEFGVWGHRNNCDVTGQESWRAIQTSCIVSAAKDGEFMVRMVYGKDAGPYGFALQMLDPVRCPVDYDVDRYSGKNFIRHGIEFTRYGRPVAYHLTTTDETEFDYQYGGRKYVRVPANEIIHGYRKDMVGQKRGLPWMATALYTMRHLGGFEEAVIVNARIGASKMPFMTFKEGSDGPEYDEDNPPEIDIEAGTMGILPSGASIEHWNPQFPAGESAPFVKHLLRKIASGLGVPYNELAADLEGVNFSSIRQGTLDSRESWKELQEWLIESLIQPVFEAWLPYALLAGRIKVGRRALPPSEMARYAVVSWQGRRWDWIDPSADSDAAVKSKNNFLKSPSTIIREQGRDPGAVWAESAADMRAMLDELKANGFKDDEAMELLKIGFGLQPKAPAAAGKPPTKEA